jgi:hypothetical protein
MNAKAIAAWILSGGVGITILAFAMQFWISLNVKAQLKEAGIVPVATVTALETRVEGLEVIHGKDIVRVESKAERIAQILMED